MHTVQFVKGVLKLGISTEDFFRPLVVFITDKLCVVQIRLIVLLLQ